MTVKKFLLILTFLLFSILISACGGAAYSSTSWHGLAAEEDTAYLSAGAQVYAVDVNSGIENWRFPEKPNQKGFYANPVLTAGGELLVASYDNKLYSVDPKTGIENRVLLTTKNRLIASPLVMNDIIYQPSSDGFVYAVELNGVEKWNTELGEPLWSQPASAPDCGCIYIASMDHTVYSLNASTGKVLWQSPELGGAMVGTPAVGADGILYVGTFGNQIVALDAKDGSISWQEPTDDWVWAGPVLDEDILYYGDKSGNLYALDTTNRNLVWKKSLPNPILDKVVILDESIYMTTEGDTLYIVNKSNGDINDQRVIGGLIYSSPLISGETILVAPTKADALLYGLNFDGSQQWTPFTPAKK